MSTPYVSRSGRVIKKPDFYEPVERPEDDFDEDEYDDDEGDEDDIEEEEEEEEDDDEDADDKGNLKGFVVDDEDDEDCD